MKINIKNIEYFLPKETEDNNSLLIDNPDWIIEDIEKKTGINNRHIAKSKSIVDMAELAIRKLLETTDINTNDIDFILLVTQSPLYPLPTSACILHSRLKLKKNCIAYDINLGCSGFVYALAQAGSLIESGLAEKGLIVCSEKYSQYIDVHDRSCKPLFSDAAAATLIEKSYDKSEIIGFDLGTDGSGYENIIVKPDTDENYTKTGKLYMNGRSVFMFTMSTVNKSVKSLLKKVNMNINDIDIFIFHQASKIVFDNLKRTLTIPEDKMFINYNKIGNTVSASIPIAIKDALSAGKLYDGCKVMFVGFGVGLSWGSCIMKWNNSK